MSAIDKTVALGRQMIPVSKLRVNELNPNVMNDMEFNLLADNIEKMGITDAILVRPVDDWYRIVGGAHRFEVAKVMGFKEVPCTIVTDPEFDDDQEKFQIVRMNVIRGRMTPDKFIKLYESLGQKYSDEILKDAFGFADEEEFRKLIKQVQKNLPADMQEVFKEATKEIKTIDDLSLILNSLFSKYGDTLPYGYMLLDFGGKESIWLRMSDKTKKAIYALGDVCRSNKRTMDDMVGGALQKLITDEKLIMELIKCSPEIINYKAGPEQAHELPTQDFLDSIK